MLEVKKKKKRIVIDFEVLTKAKFWLCCFKDLDTNKKCTIVNDRKALIKLYDAFKDAIWIGYNIKGYDQYIFKALIAGVDPFNVSDKIIREGIKPWEIDSRLNKISLTYFELSNRIRTLKELELFMGEDIRETTVSFDLDRTPTKKEVQELTHYCLHDVEMTAKVFDVMKNEFDSHEFLIDYYNLDYKNFCKTKSQLSAHILGAKKPIYSRQDEFDFEIVDTLKLTKYQFAKDWYMDKNNRDYSKSLTIKIGNTKLELGWGGIHGAEEMCSEEGYIVNSDGAAFYPSLMIIYGLLSRNVSSPERFKKIRDTRLEFKLEGNGKDIPFKIVLNATYGSSKDENNELYDPKMANGVCVNGQLLLLDLIEKVEIEFGDDVKFIQANTDGVMFRLKDKEAVERYLKVCEEWSKRTSVILEHDYIKKIVQKDVNNFVFIDNKNKVKQKGAYVKKLSKIDYDLPIVNKAIVAYIIEGKGIRETIDNCNELIEFQKCVKTSKNHNGTIHNNIQSPLRVYRVFASKNLKDGPILQLNGTKPAKIGNTPERCFIQNDNIIGKKVPDNLDKEWYISLAQKRLESFLPNVQYEKTLFDILGI